MTRRPLRDTFANGTNLPNRNVRPTIATRGRPDMTAAQRTPIEQVCVESRPINSVSIPTLKMVLQYFFEIFCDDKNYRSKRSKKFDAAVPKVKFYKSKKDKAERAKKPVEKAEQPKPVDKRKLSTLTRQLTSSRPPLARSSNNNNSTRLHRVALRRKSTAYSWE
jgi:hypothetical protein